MIQKDFTWFRHFWKQILPAMSEVILSHRLEPVFDIADSRPYDAWHIPLGELRRLDEVLEEMEGIDYLPMKAHHYM